ncbi:hypothetical protein P4639_22620 [Priestia megaterium]|uniref:DUF4376 domain-containing protein n=1 Tax=Priestia megaterium TaxID=1404 RepID=UPI002E1AA4D0|nr:hypothetical protein [Priestia megaterium]
MEELKKVIFLDEEFREVDSIQEVQNYNAGIDTLYYESESEGGCAITGISRRYIVVPESYEYNEFIDEVEVVKFYENMFIDRLSRECSEMIEEGFEYNGEHFSYDMKDQSNFNEQLMLLTLDEDDEEVEWKTRDNGYKTFSRDEFIAICKQGKKRKTYLKKGLDIMRNNINQMTKVEDLFKVQDFKTELDKIKQ